MPPDHRVAWITGGGSGIGAATARLLGRAGVRVALTGRTTEKLEHVAAQIADAGGEALVAAGDVSHSADVQRIVNQITERFERLDHVFAHAGVNGVWAPIEQLGDEEWDHTLRINLRGTFLTCKYAVPHLRRRRGSIVITSSVNGTRMFSNSGASAYAASKAGQIALMKMLALELAADRIRVNAICPGAIESDIGAHTTTRDLEHAREPVLYPEGEIPLTDGRPGKAEDVARLVWFLFSDDARHISGAEIHVDGAQSLLQG